MVSCFLFLTPSSSLLSPSIHPSLSFSITPPSPHTPHPFLPVSPSLFSLSPCRPENKNSKSSTLYVLLSPSTWVEPLNETERHSHEQRAHVISRDLLMTTCTEQLPHPPVWSLLFAGFFSSSYLSATLRDQIFRCDTPPPSLPHLPLLSPSLFATDLIRFPPQERTALPQSLGLLASLQFVEDGQYKPTYSS